jgi:hypothetical protein
MDYEVSRADAGSRRTAVVAATTTWPEFPRLWGRLLGEVWDCLHTGGADRGCPNILLYLDGVPNVEVGVLLDQPFARGVPHGHRPSGTRWEIYGPHDDDPAQQWTEVHWLLR